MVDGARPKETGPSHLNECLKTHLTEQERRLVSILEIVQVERHVPNSASRHYWRGRKPLEREALARAFVAKAVYRHPTTSDLIRALQSAENLRRVCGFVTVGDIPSESTFSRAFAEFAVSRLGNRVHDNLPSGLTRQAWTLGMCRSRIKTVAAGRSSSWRPTKQNATKYAQVRNAQTVG